MQDYQRLKLMAEVAHLYYEEDLTQGQIGKMLNISHSTVSRMLKEARETKMAEVILRFPISTPIGLEKEVQSRFGLKEVRIRDVDEGSYRDVVGKVGQLAAQVLEWHLDDDITLSISLGMAVAATVRALRPTRSMRFRIARLQGATDSELMEGTDLMQILASQFGGEFTIIPSPWILMNEQVTRALLMETSVKDALEIAAKADIALVGMGSMHPDTSTLLRNHLLTLQELNELVSAGAVGEICGKHYDKNGQVLDVPFNHRTVAVDPTCLRDIPVVVGVAVGANKVDAILGAIRGKLINVLVTDITAARLLLERSELK